MNYNSVTIRLLERGSIRSFMERHASYLRGRVLDFGCGKQPYRDLVEGEYIAHDPRFEEFPLYRLISDPVDVVMVNQVLQYLINPGEVIFSFRDYVKSGGHFVLTYNTCWAIVLGDDPTYAFHTPHGIETMLKDAGFEIVVHEERAKVSLGRFDFSLGGGVVARKI